MVNTRKKIIVALCVFFAVILIGFVFYSSRTITENFDSTTGPTGPTAADESKSTKHTKETSQEQSQEQSQKQSQEQSQQPTLKLSNREQEIFTDLLNNKLTDVKIDSLIQSGILTENMIEKFLQNVQKKDNFVVAPPPLENNMNVPDDVKIVEGFTGFTSLTPMYATAKEMTPETNQIYSQY
jgi:sensor histidine kinase YesM